jgi:hypothetical protein
MSDCSYNTHIAVALVISSIQCKKGVMSVGVPIRPIIEL